MVLPEKKGREKMRGKTKCSICGKKMDQGYYPHSTSPMWAKKSGKPYEINICGKRECLRKAWSDVREMYGFKKESEEK